MLKFTKEAPTILVQIAFNSIEHVKSRFGKKKKKSIIFESLVIYELLIKQKFDIVDGR